MSVQPVLRLPPLLMQRGNSRRVPLLRFPGAEFEVAARICARAVRAADEAELGCGQMGSTLMGPLQK